MRSGLAVWIQDPKKKASCSYENFLLQYKLSSERNKKAALHVRRLSCTQGRRNTRWRDVRPWIND